VLPDTISDFTSTDTIAGSVQVDTGEPSANPLMAMVTVGTTRKTATYTRNGTAPRAAAADLARLTR
jgi:hypothetical protein